MILIAELRGDLVGDKTAIVVHCLCDAPQQLVLGLRLNDKKRQTGNNVVTV